MESENREIFPHMTRNYRAEMLPRVRPFHLNRKIFCLALVTKGTINSL